MFTECTVLRFPAAFVMGAKQRVKAGPVKRKIRIGETFGHSESSGGNHSRGPDLRRAFFVGPWCAGCNPLPLVFNLLPVNIDPSMNQCG